MPDSSISLSDLTEPMPEPTPYEKHVRQFLLAYASSSADAQEVVHDMMAVIRDPEADCVVVEMAINTVVANWREVEKG